MRYGGLLWFHSPDMIVTGTVLAWQAEVGDDVYGEDSTVNRLQDYAAELMGKECALLMPSGTMGNLSAVLAHCPERGTEARSLHQSVHTQDAKTTQSAKPTCHVRVQVLIGDNSHIYNYEGGGISALGGLAFQRRAFS